MRSLARLLPSLLPAFPAGTGDSVVMVLERPRQLSHPARNWKVLTTYILEPSLMRCLGDSLELHPSQLLSNCNVLE